MSVMCPDCQKEMTLREGKYGKFMGCTGYPNCTTTQKVDQESGQPIGVPAGEKLKALRKSAHEAFDAWWTDQSIDRNEAYIWLSDKMGLNREECHIGKMDEAQCAVVIGLIEDARIS